MYETTTQIPFIDAGADGTLKLQAAVAMMMNCCQFQEYQEEEFCKFLRSNNLAVFLFSIQLDIFRRPAFRETVRTAVKIYGLRSIYGLRRLTMRTASGELLMIANATGAFFDLAAGKAVKLDPAMNMLKFDPAEPMDCLPRKVPVPATGGVELAPFEVLPSHLDPNGHLSSPFYFSIAEDRLPPGFRYNRVRVEFRKQILPSETVTIVSHDLGGGTIVTELKNGENYPCAAVEFSTFPERQ